MARIEMGAADIAGYGPDIDNGRAFYELGLMYAAGRQVELDLVTAHKWLNVAVFKGCREAAETAHGTGRGNGGRRGRRRPARSAHVPATATEDNRRITGSHDHRIRR